MKIKFTHQKTVYRIINGERITEEEWQERIEKFKNKNKSKSPFVKLKRKKPAYDKKPAHK